MLKYKDKKYKSLYEICKVLNLSYNKIYHRIKYYNYTIADAIESKNNSRASKVGIRINMYNKEYESITQLCKEKKIKKTNVYFYKHKGLNTEDAIRKVMENKNKITYKKICKIEGISRQRINQLKNSGRKSDMERYNKIMAKYGKKGA